MNRIFGMSLVDGDVTQVQINSNTLEGQFIPDQDNLRLAIASAAYGNQFAFAFDEPEPDSEGPDQIAVIGNDLRFYREIPLDLRPGGTSRGVHAGFINKANATRQLYYLNLGTGGDLDMGAVTVENLSSGTNKGDQGDFMPPGRLGEENDYMAMSPDGSYVAVVRDYATNNTFVSGVTTYMENTFATSSSSNTFGQVNHDLVIFSTDRSNLDTASHSILFLGTGTMSNSTAGGVSNGDNLAAQAHLSALHRRIDGVTFGSNTGAGERTVIFNYHGVNLLGRYPAINGRSGPGWAINPDSSYGTFTTPGLAMNALVQFKDDDGEAITFTNPSSFMSNGLEDIGDDPDGKGITGIGPTSPPFSNTDQNQAFWTTFKSHNGNYIYYVSDQLSGRNYMFGYNISGANLAGEHDQYVPFTPHASNIGFEQINVNAFNYESRFFAVPAMDPADIPAGGRDGAGLVFFIASASSAGASSSTDLEVYCFDADHGGDAVVLSAAVTDTNQNAINHMYVSMDGNVVAAQRANYTANSRNGRAVLNSNTDLFVCINVHDALAGATPDTFMISENMSHGSSVGFVGDGTLAGPQAIVFSRADPAAITDTGNRTWDDRELKISLLAEGSIVRTLDATRSHYVVIAGTRKTDDDPTDLN
jgi:hypothetical protein